jgi:undecaprenyl-phosphate 4-deoxy-4-formamido-L-arabinose transferase
MAILAGFEKMRGDVAINLDADLQNPPEEIPKLIEKIKKGHDMVGSYRLSRKDNKWRHYGSRFANYVRSLITPLKMKDQGCMFRAYSRQVVEKICRGQEHSLFIPALGWQYAENPTEIGLYHDERSDGTSKYSLYHLIRVSIDLATSTTLVPIQVVTFTGLITSMFSFILFTYLLLRRLIIGPEVGGVFTLIALVIFLVGIAIMGIGVIGEYVGRIYQIISGRPRYSIKKVLSK